jgi:hypothetical protein
MLDKVAALPDELGEVQSMLADNGYFSAANVAACVAAEIEPVIAMSRQPHHPPLAERFAPTPAAPAEDTGRSKALRAAQTNPGIGVRHYQIGDGLPAVPAARERRCPGRVEPGDHVVEHEAVVRPLPPPPVRQERAFTPHQAGLTTETGCSAAKYDRSGGQLGPNQGPIQTVRQW